MYLLDTDVLSITSPLSRLAGEEIEAWRDWVRKNADALHLSVVTLMEVRFGLEKLRAKKAVNKAAALNKWLLVTETIYRARIVWVPPEIAHKAGELLYRAERAGVTPGSEDAIIAASAELTGFRLVSRNERHMRSFGVQVLNPLKGLPK
jgi:predicted nucleic acid-binding protein